MPGKRYENKNAVFHEIGSNWLDFARNGLYGHYHLKNLGRIPLKTRGLGNMPGPRNIGSKTAGNMEQ